MENKVFLFDAGAFFTTSLLQTDDFETAPLTRLQKGWSKEKLVSAITAAFTTGKVCGDNIVESFFKDAVKKNAIIMAIATFTDRQAAEFDPKVEIDVGALLGENLRGFILARPERLAPGGTSGERSFYVDLICASAASPDNAGVNGKALMEFATRYARYRGFSEVALSAIAPVLTYYPRLGLGFKYRKSCDDAPVPVSTDALCSRMSGKNPFAPKNEKTADLMFALNRAGVEHEHEHTRARACAAADLDMKTFEEKKCHNDGYILKKCFKDDARTKSKSPKIECPKVPAPARHSWQFLPNYIQGFLSSLIGK